MNRPDEDIIGTKPVSNNDDLPLFARPAPFDIAAVTNRSAGTRRPRKSALDPHPVFGKPTGPGVREFVKRALLDHVIDLAERTKHMPWAGERGFTAYDVREVAIAKQIAGTGDEEEQRAWSWIGPWLAVLARRGSIAVLKDAHGHVIERSSSRRESHANRQIVYTASAAQGNP